MRPDDVGDPENWTGGFYELAIDLGPRDDPKVEAALVAVWRAAGAVGPFAEVEGKQQEAELSLRALQAYGHLRGLTRPPSVGPVVTGVVSTRLDDGDDWLSTRLRT